MKERVFAHTGHRELWDWLAKNPDKGKCDWPGWGYNGGIYREVIVNCFACEFTSMPINCEECPLVWPGNPNCTAKKGLFDAWGSVGKSTERSQLAAQIRDLPVKPGVKCI